MTENFEILPKTIENNLVPVDVLVPQSQTAFLQQMNIGNGDNSFRIDPTQGIWLGADKFADAPFSVTLAGLMVAAGLTVSNVNYGKTSFSDSAHAGYHISSSGFYFGSAADANYIKYNIGTGAFDFVGNVSGRASSVLASAINSVGELITANLDTSAKTILGSFTFGASGAIAMNTDANNGLWISPTGILGKKSGEITFAINTSGDAIFSGSITGSTITGGMLRTATSGMRVSIVDTATAMQAANSVALINSSSHAIAEIGTNTSVIMRILPTDIDQQALLIQSASGLALTSNLVSFDVQKSNSSGHTLSLTQRGTGSALVVNAINSDQTNYLVYVSGSTYLRNLVEISSSFNSNNSNTMLHISMTGASGVNTLQLLDNAGLGKGIQINTTNASNASSALYIPYGGTGWAVKIDTTNSDNPNATLYVTTNNTTALPIYAQGGTVATHFHRMIGSGAYTIWVSDGTTPNGNLSANIGDICIGGSSGHMFWNNNGSTGWTQL